MLMKTLRKLWPSPKLVARLVPVLGMVAVGLGAYVAGRSAVNRASGQTRLPEAVVQQAELTDYQQRVVAYVYDTIPITREELGEFLIKRFGADRLELLVNNKIITMACKAKGIEVTDAQVEAQFWNEFNSARAVSPNMTLKDFENIFLRRHGKTLVEFKEDVIRPKLMMAEYIKPTIEVTEDDLRKGFEGRYGPKVECRMIVLPDNQHKYAMWEKAKTSEEEFVRIATHHNMPPLGAQGGKVPPIHKHFGDANVERIAFGLKVGEVSPLIAMPDKTVIILKCDRHVPADTTKRFENEFTRLRDEMFNLKLNQRIPEAIGELRKNANPRLMIRPEQRQEEIERAALTEIHGSAPPPKK